MATKLAAILGIAVVLLVHGEGWGRACVGLPSRDKMLIEAAINGDVAAVGHALAAGASVGAKYEGHSSLVWACMQGNMATVSRLMEAGAQLATAEEEQLSPLGAAAMFGHVELAQFLLKKGASVEVAGPLLGSPLRIAVVREDLEMVNVLLAAGADAERPLYDGETAISLAGSILGQGEVYQRLVQSEAGL